MARVIVIMASRTASAVCRSNGPLHNASTARTCFVLRFGPADSALAVTCIFRNRSLVQDAGPTVQCWVTRMNLGGYLDIKRMLGEVEAEIVKLQRVANALRGIESSQTKSGTTAGTSHRMSAAARRKISLAQKSRWAAKQKSGAQPTKPKRMISAASRRKMAAAQKARWAKVKAKA